MRTTVARLLCAGIAIFLSSAGASAHETSRPPYAASVNFNVAQRAAIRSAYYDSLRVCRLQQPGTLARRVHLPATQHDVARCLKNRPRAG